VAMRRIQAFLICDEINETLINDTKTNDDSVAIEIKDSTAFHWGLKMQPDLPPRRKGRGRGNDKNKNKE